jgi:8-oxo-dGTP diphosphatase
MGSRPDGWWRDRAGAAARLHTEITALAAVGTALPGQTGPPRFVMVLEGAARAAAARVGTARADGTDGADGADGVRVVQADGSGDDAIVALVREQPGRRFVVTADRELRRRCEAAGATVLGPGWLLGLLRQEKRQGNRP